ncbi:MAG: arginine N-succinyltransferase [Phycisphaeraceae bacterium]|nr:arginine N-succinyltransferase [Phycisphaeraceae bacterium]
MFLIRQTHPDDRAILLKLAKMVHFINLPPDKEVVADKVRWSTRSFRSVRKGEAPEDVTQVREIHNLGGAAGRSPQFMFSAVDTTTGNVIGTSALIAKMGSAGTPNVVFQLRKKHFFSEDLQQGTTHVTAQLVLDESGPTEIGGLILGPSYRGHPSKIGKQLSLIRFHYIGLHRERFQDRILAEMMAPITPDGRNVFWEEFTQKFINLSYDEADRFCQKSREFMTSLLPREEIYLTMLPAAARSGIAQVGRDTAPARAMLEKLGFRYHDRIDPFDGGPHLHASTDEIDIVRDTKLMEIGPGLRYQDAETMCFVSTDRKDGGDGMFRAVMAPCKVEGGRARVADEALALLAASEGEQVGFTALPNERMFDPFAGHGGRSASISGSNPSPEKAPK